MANHPKLILGDEPTGELDSVTAGTIYQAFRDLNKEFGVTTLIVSHDQGIARHVDRVVAIRDGKTSSETVRVESTQVEGELHVEEVFEELVVLDSAGRLQVPKDYLEKFGIRGRARLDITENGILILPAPNSKTDQSAQVLADGRLVRTRERGLRALFRRKKN